VPSRTGTDIKPETVKILSEIDNIVAIKEATGDVARTLKIRDLCGDDIDVYSGNDDITLPLLACGAKGVISVMANIAPKDMHDLTQLYFDGESEKALALQLKMMNLIEALFCEVNPIPVKTALSMMGLCSGELRLPLCEMENATAEKLRCALTEYGISI
jgi:4-hydroxy-tetrahydrodipicolinate synthase